MWLTECNDITDAGLEGLVTGAPLLQSLKLNSCDAITDAVLHRAVKAAASLKVLMIKSCERLTHRGLTRCKGLGIEVHRADERSIIVAMPDGT